MKVATEDIKALEQVEGHEDSHIVHIYPAVSNKYRRIIATTIGDKFEIICYKQVRLSRGGVINCKKISYDHQGFGGGYTDRFWGYRKHAKKSIRGSFRATEVYVIRGTLEQMRKLKESLRKLVGLGTWPIHITDSHEEALALSRIYFNPNALFLYNGRSYVYDSAEFDAMVDRFREKMLAANVPLSNVCAGGSTAMGAAGIRRSKDFDYLALKDSQYVLKDRVYSPHESQLKYYPATKEEIISNPRYHFWYRGVKILALDGCFNLKSRRRGWPKDHKDIIRMLWFMAIARVKILMSGARGLDFRPLRLREKIINAWNRFAFLGKDIDFPDYCSRRGYACDEVACRRLLANRRIVRVEACRVAISQLRTVLFGQKYAMKDSLPYKAMCGLASYSEYERKVREQGEVADYVRGESYPHNLLAEIKENGFDRNHPIIINNKNYIIDGQHRSCCMLKLFGEGYQMHALRIYTLPDKGSFLERLFCKRRRKCL